MWFKVVKVYCVGLQSSLPQVQFVDEEAVDTGGPSREFWRLFGLGVMKQYCIGEEGICLFVKNVPALEVLHVLQ